MDLDPVTLAPPGADHDLLARIRQRDEAALAALYDRYSGMVYTRALRLVGDRDLAQQVLQDTFVRCWQSADRFDPARGRMAGWLMSIARNLAIDVLRGRQHHDRQHERGLKTEATGPMAAGTDMEDAVTLRQVVTTALNSLPANQRRPLELAFYGGMTQSEIAIRLGEPLGTIKTRMRTGMEHLRGLLRPLVEPGGEERRLP